MLKILHRDDLHRGGFAGLREHRLVVDEKVGGNNKTWNGLGNFVYLADAQFIPHGETKMHPHRELDVISVMVEGRIKHQGTLSNGAEITRNQVQVQRAGSEGFLHNEINPDNTENRMIQLWVLPERYGDAAGYKVYTPEPGELTRVYGGADDQDDTFDSHTVIEVAQLEAGETVEKAGEFIAYITRGSGLAQEQSLKDGDMFRGTDFSFTAEHKDTQLILITKE